MRLGFGLVGTSVDICPHLGMEQGDGRDDFRMKQSTLLNGDGVGVTFVCTVRRGHFVAVSSLALAGFLSLRAVQVIVFGC